MTLIRCRGCGQPVSDKLPVCPKCKYPTPNFLNNPMTDKLNSSENWIPAENASGLNPYDGSAVNRTLPSQAKKFTLFALVAIIAIVLFLVFWLPSRKPYFTASQSSINKWICLKQKDGSRYYKGTVVSDYQKPFVAVVSNSIYALTLVYMENGSGIIERLEDTGRPFALVEGYLHGETIRESDIEISSYINSQDLYAASDPISTLSIDISMKQKKTGVLICDIAYKDSGKTEYNVNIAVKNGMAHYYAPATFPYEGSTKISVIPRMFCKAVPVTKDDYQSIHALDYYSLHNLHNTCYRISKSVSFKKFPDSIIIYQCEFKDSMEERTHSFMYPALALLEDQECNLLTYDYVNVTEKADDPKYYYNIIGAIQWTSIWD